VLAISTFYANCFLVKKDDFLTLLGKKNVSVVTH